jgi:putative membrane protein
LKEIWYIFGDISNYPFMKQLIISSRRGDRMTKRNEKKVTDDSKYVEQHLSNERTFLAWIRTAITIMGIGFLSARLHLFSPKSETSFLGESISKWIGILSVIIGMFSIVYATTSYWKKRKGINTQTFLAPRGAFIFLFVTMLLIGVLLLIYLVFI